MSQIKWNYLLLSYLALFCLGLIDNTRGAFYPEFLRQMEFTASEGSRLFSVVALSGFLMNFTTRYWLPHVGIVKAILTSLFFMFFGTILVSMMPFFMEYKHSLLIISGLCLGLGIGGSTISMNLLVTKASPPQFMSRAFAGLHSTYGVSSLIAPLLFNFLFLLFGKWDLAYLSLSLLPLVILSIYLTKNLPDIGEIPKTPLKAPVGLIQRLPFGLMLASYVVAEILVSTRLVYFLTENEKMPLTEANYLLALFFLGLAFGRIAFSVLKIPGPLFVHLLISHALTLLFFFLGLSNHYFLALTGLTMSWFFPTTMAWLQTHFKSGIEFMTASVLTLTGFLLLGMHDLFGRIVEMYDVKVAFLMGPLASAISLLLLIFIEVRRKIQSS